MKDKIKGTVVFIFQPAEEGAPAGEEGGHRTDGQRGRDGQPEDRCGFWHPYQRADRDRQDRLQARRFYGGGRLVHDQGQGKQTHGSQPWMGIDPIAVATQIYTGLQMIVARESELTKAPVVITIGKINGGVRENIIPEELTMAGTIRTLDAAMQKDVHEKIRLTATKIAESMGATAEVTIDTKTLVTYNNPNLVKKMLPSLQKAVGAENVSETEWTTGAEDFSYYGTKAPAFFFFVGGMPKGKDPKKTAAHHTPDFYIDDSRLDVGIKAFCNIVFDYAG